MLYEKVSREGPARAAVAGLLALLGRPGTDLVLDAILTCANPASPLATFGLLVPGAFDRADAVHRLVPVASLMGLEERRHFRPQRSAALDRRHRLVVLHPRVETIWPFLPVGGAYPGLAVRAVYAPRPERWTARRAPTAAELDDLIHHLADAAVRPAALGPDAEDELEAYVRGIRGAEVRHSLPPLVRSREVSDLVRSTLHSARLQGREEAVAEDAEVGIASFEAAQKSLIDAATAYAGEADADSERRPRWGARDRD